jgi:glucan phosphoethanolaminetransferase (alkaline phosphatase superfamily)
MAPAFAPASVFVPQLAQPPAGVPLLVAMSLGAGLLSLAAARLLRAMAGPSQPGRWAAVGALTASFLWLSAAVAYYGRFGYYPGAAIVADFTAAPRAFIAYTLSDVGLSDILGVSVAFAAGVALNWRATVLVWRHAFVARDALAPLLGGSVLFAGLYFLPLSQQHSFLVLEHSMPFARYVVNTLYSMNRSGIEVIAAEAPAGSPDVAAADDDPLPKPRHVLLIIAEALRADHLSVYGYARDTTPFLASDAARWIRFTHAYSHASRTADSLPVFFNSRYLAGVDRDNGGARALWNGLRQANVRTHFYSAGAIEWGGLVTSLAYDGIDERLNASDFPAESRAPTSRMRFDFSVDDSPVVRRYIEALGSSSGHAASFASVHLVGSHFPFHYSGTPDVFFPSLRQATDLVEGEPAVDLEINGQDIPLPTRRVREFANSYDNSLRHVDAMIRQMIEALARQGVLEDSVVIVTSDHGESLGEHRTLFHGTTLYEEQVRVPLLIRVGDRLAPLAERLSPRAGHLAGQIDLIPTIYDLLTDGPLPAIFEGVSWLRGPVKTFELLLFRGIGEKAAFVTTERKYVFDVVGRRAEEYDLRLDPREERNLWTGSERSSPAFLEALRRRHPPLWR